MPRAKSDESSLEELRARTRIAEIFLEHKDEEMYVRVLDVVLELMESQVGVFRPYGSAAMSVFLWQFERSQTFFEQVESLGDPIPHTDNWQDNKDGATLGAQFSAGALYQFRPLMLIDVSLAYHWVNIGTKNGALAYWGYPVNTWDEDRINEGKGSVNYLQFRVGLRYGR